MFTIHYPLHLGDNRDNASVSLSATAEHRSPIRNHIFAPHKSCNPMRDVEGSVIFHLDCDHYDVQQSTSDHCGSATR